MKLFKKLFDRKVQNNDLSDTQANQPAYKPIQVLIDEEMIENIIKTKDAQKLIDPLWWCVSIYDNEEKYEQDLASFTLSQRYIFAIQWYVAEVNNGGHTQFYFNSTGIVWEDALKGFSLIGAEKNADILKETIKRMGGSPSKNRETRDAQMNQYESEFSDLDNAYYDSEIEMYEKLFAYVKENSGEFLFSGEVEKPEWA